MPNLRQAVLLLCLIVSPTSPLLASAPVSNTVNPEALSRDFEYLSTFVNPDCAESFDPQKIQNILKFQLSPPEEQEQFTLESRDGQTASWLATEIEKGLDHILRYAFNPKVPSHILTPSSVRICTWNESLKSSQNPIRLWERIETLNSPIVIRGLQQVGITPDVFTGAYYTYDEYKAIILFKHNGKNVLLNLSKQKDVSDVGKKGLVIGSDEDWNYYYSGRPGLTKPGLGWVRAYMYGSFSVSMFYETDQNCVKHSVFKWLRAGWAGVNMVKSRHIRNGLLRYAKAFQEIIESPRLPPPAQLAEISNAFNKLSDAELKSRIITYYKILEQKQLEETKQLRCDLSDFLDSDACVDQLSRPEMAAILTVESMKSLLGKQVPDESGILIGQSQSVSTAELRP